MEHLIVTSKISNSGLNRVYTSSRRASLHVLSVVIEGIAPVAASEFSVANFNGYLLENKSNPANKL